MSAPLFLEVSTATHEIAAGVKSAQGWAIFDADLLADLAGQLAAAGGVALMASGIAGGRGQRSGWGMRSALEGRAAASRITPASAWSLAAFL